MKKTDPKQLRPNVIFNLYSHFQIKIVEEILKQHQFGNIWCVYNQNRFPTTQKINWLYFPQLTQADYPTNLSQFEPVDEDLLQKMAVCESESLKMMDRLTFNGQMPYQKRKQQYLNHLKYWHHILKNESISIVIMGSIPHEVYDFVLYHLCQLMGKKIIIVHQNRVYDSVLQMSDYKKSMSDVLKRFRQLEKKFSQTQIEKIDLNPNFAAQFSQQTNSAKGFVHFNIKPSFAWKRSLVYYRSSLIYLQQNQGEIKKLISPIFWWQHLSSFVSDKLNVLQIHLFLHNKYQQPNAKQKYLYFPLHLQPECTTSPMAGAYVEQQLIADIVASGLPKNFYLVVKEHPVQPLSYRSTDFYRQLLSNKKVMLVDPSTSSRQLIQNSLAVVTATGTAGWEALFLRKPVLMFGHDIFQYAPGIFPVKSVDNVRDALTKILHGNKPELKKVKIFLRAMQETLLTGCIDEYYLPFSRLSEQENIVNISSAIEKQIDHA